MTPAKLYLVTRADLAPGAQLAQTAHVALRFALERPEEALAWQKGGEHIVILAAHDEIALRSIAFGAGLAGCHLSEFYEPAMGDALTAIALASSDVADRFVKRLPLAMSRE